MVSAAVDVTAAPFSTVSVPAPRPATDNAPVTLSAEPAPLTVSSPVLVAALASDTLPATSATPPLKIEKVPAPALPTVMALADQSEPLPLPIIFPSLPALPAIVVMPEVVMLPHL